MACPGRSDAGNGEPCDIRMTNKKFLTKQYIGNIFNVNVQVKK